MLPIEVEQIPERFSYMIKEVAVKRYNRIGAEGMTSEAVDGRSNAYELNDFKEYEAIIDNYFNARTRTKRKGCVLLRYEDRAVFQSEQAATYNPKTRKKKTL